MFWCIVLLAATNDCQHDAHASLSPSESKECIVNIIDWALVAQWTARWTSNPAVAGSSPVKSEFYNKNIISWALVAQWIARWTSNPTVAGSSPVKSEFWVFYLLASMNLDVSQEPANVTNDCEQDSHASLAPPESPNHNKNITSWALVAQWIAH